MVERNQSAKGAKRSAKPCGPLRKRQRFLGAFDVQGTLVASDPPSATSATALQQPLRAVGGDVSTEFEIDRSSADIARVVLFSRPVPLLVDNFEFDPGPPELALRSVEPDGAVCGWEGTATISGENLTADTDVSLGRDIEVVGTRAVEGGLRADLWIDGDARRGTRTLTADDPSTVPRSATAGSNRCFIRHGRSCPIVRD
jgi:hypothetical protein